LSRGQALQGNGGAAGGFTAEPRLQRSRPTEVPSFYSCHCGEEWFASSEDNRCAICGRRCAPIEEIEITDSAAEVRGGIDGVIVPRDALRRAARELRDAAAMLDYAKRERADSDYGEAAWQARRAATELEQLLGAVP
jgi:hypothetical protein